MSDFLASLVARSLGDGAGVSETHGAVLPRSPTAFEPGGPDVSAEPENESGPEAAAVPPSTVRAPAEGTTPDRAAEPDDHGERQAAPQTAERLAPNQRSPEADVPQVPAAPAMSDAPLPEAPPVVSEQPVRPRLDDATPTPQHDPAPSMPTQSSPLESRSAISPQTRDERPNSSLEPEIRIGRREAAEVSSHAPPIAPKAPDPEPTAPGRRGGDPQLEKIVRQMVLSPRPDPAPPPVSEAPAPSQGDKDEESTSVAPRLAPPPETRIAQGLTPTFETREGQRLSPVPVPPRMPDQPAQTTVRISIGRIEVRTNAESPTDTAPRTERPQAKLMSLDDYLAQRAKEG